MFFSTLHTGFSHYFKQYDCSHLSFVIACHNKLKVLLFIFFKILFVTSILLVYI